MSNSSAVSIARTHVETWSNHDFDAARASLATDIHVTVMSTNPAIPSADLTGVEDYMQGLIVFAQPVVPGSLRILASKGDERNALLMLTVQMASGPNGTPVTVSGARLYLLDENKKIEVEQVIFYLSPD